MRHLSEALLGLAGRTMARRSRVDGPAAGRPTGSLGQVPASFNLMSSMKAALYVCPDLAVEDELYVGAPGVLRHGGRSQPTQELRLAASI